MKQGISNIWLLGMIVVFIAMFSAYIATTIKAITLNGRKSIWELNICES